MEDYKNFDNKFKFVLTASKRAKQILKGSKKLIGLKAQNPLTIALEEIKQGLVTPDNINTLIEDRLFFSDIDEDQIPPEEIIREEITAARTKDTDLEEDEDEDDSDAIDE